MELLLTGKPNCGKTTLLKGFIESIPAKQGFVADEMRENGDRTGFRLVSSEGETAALAIVDSPSDFRVYNYGVELQSLEQFLGELQAIMVITRSCCATVATSATVIYSTAGVNLQIMPGNVRISRR